MSRNRRTTGGVRGPASALTSFLANLGVEPAARLTTYGRSLGINEDQNNDTANVIAHDGPVIEDENTLDPAGAVTARTVEAGPSQVGEGLPELEVDRETEPGGGRGRRRKRKDGDEANAADSLDSPGPSKRKSRGKRASSVDSEDLDADAKPPAGPSKSVTPIPNPPKKGVKGGFKTAPQSLKAVGQFMECGECMKRFTVTAYTKEHPSQPSAWLCVHCCYTLGIDPFAKDKKPAKPKTVAKKEDRAKIVHYEQRKGVPLLGDICIELIGKYIEDVEQLGEIGGINMDKVCKIISKSRRLTPETAQLFYSKERKELAMYDCTSLVTDSYLAMANLCPNLERLHLHLCGQLSTDAVTSWGKSLKQLKCLELYGPFLVRKEGWISFLKTVGKRLEGLLITQSPRFDQETVETLVRSCPNITQLRLAEIGLLCSDFLEPLGKLKKLAVLDLTSAGSPISDEAVTSLLSKIGKSLLTLNLSDNPELTDVTLAAIAKYCPKLRALYLRNAVELTDDGVAEFFSTMKENGHPGLEIINLEKGNDLKGKALRALVDHSGPTVEKLSLLGWRGVEKEALSDLSKCGHLKELDIGWCRQVTDFSIKEVLDSCDLIEVLKVWGCNQLSDAVPRKKGVKIIGIETHSI